MALSKTLSEKETRSLIQSASVEVRFEITVDPTPYTKTAPRSLVAPVADGKVVVSVIVDGVESSTTMRFPALRRIERSLPDLIVRNMAQHTARFLPERLREIVTDLCWEAAGQVDSDSRKSHVEDVRNSEATRARKRLRPVERDNEQLADRLNKKRAEWEARILRVMRAIDRDGPISKAEVARRLNLGSEQTRTQAVKKVLDRHKLNWEQLKNQVKS